MPRPRVVSAKNRPYTHVELSDGDWVNIKNKLNSGEAGELYDATYRSNVGSGDRSTTREMKMSVFNNTRILLYVLEWSFIDDEKKPLAVSIETIRALDTETTEELHEAITTVEVEQTRLENEAKRAAGVGAPTSASNNASEDSSPRTQAVISQPERTEFETNS